ncbi:MAG: hypothetical protein ABI811_04905 [Acidobacteriota bacterium]
MRKELQELMASAGVQLVWLDSKNNISVDRMVSVELRGDCQFGSGKSGKFKDHSALASTAVQDGKVLPFSWVDCVALDQFVRPALHDESKAERSEIYGRAMARLLAHEFYHVLAQTEAHTSSGISKTAFSVNDLLADHLTFQTEALTALHIEAPVVLLSASFGEEADDISRLEAAEDALAAR